MAGSFGQCTDPKQWQLWNEVYLKRERRARIACSHAEAAAQQKAQMEAKPVSLPEIVARTPTPPASERAPDISDRRYRRQSPIPFALAPAEVRVCVATLMCAGKFMWVGRRI
jgi:hypothetical protein